MPATTTCGSAAAEAAVAQWADARSRGQGHLRRAGLLADARCCQHPDGDVRRHVQRSPQPVHVRQHARRGVVEVEQRLEQAIADFPAVKVDTSDGFSQAQQDSINPLLYMFYVLLALSVIVSLFGIVNTLVLGLRAHAGARDAQSGGDDATAGPTHDPPREHHHRADRRRARARTGHRARGACHSRALERGPRLLGPGGQPGGVRDRRGHRGMLAAIFPARRAAKLNVLQALQYE